MLQLKHISVRYGGNVVLNNFSLTVHTGKTLAITGERFTGKTTVANLCCGLITPDKGEALADNVTLTSQQAAALLAYVPYSHVIPSSTDVNKRILLFVRAAGKDCNDTELTKAKELTGLTMPSRSENYQSIAARMAAAVLRGCRYIILDEPDALLTHDEICSLAVVLKRLSDAGMGILVTTNNRYFEELVADEIIRLPGKKSPV